MIQSLLQSGVRQVGHLGRVPDAVQEQHLLAIQGRREPPQRGIFANDQLDLPPRCGGQNDSDSKNRFSAMLDRGPEVELDLKTGEPAKDLEPILAAILADGTNLGLSKMAGASADS
jgi:hypothetical protein